MLRFLTICSFSKENASAFASHFLLFFMIFIKPNKENKIHVYSYSQIFVSKIFGVIFPIRLRYKSWVCSLHHCLIWKWNNCWSWFYYHWIFTGVWKKKTKPWNLLCISLSLLDILGSLHPFYLKVSIKESCGDDEFLIVDHPFLHTIFIWIVCKMSNLTLYSYLSIALTV